MPERTYRILGRVQGVGFRWWTCTVAQRVGVTGSVRNHPDGSVEVQARGSDEALAALRAELERGPPGAQVESVTERDAVGVPTDGFRVARG